MATICYYYKMTPEQFLALTLPQYRALSEGLTEILKAEAGHAESLL